MNEDEIISQTFHALEVTLITVLGFTMGFLPGLYAGFTAWTLREGSHVHAKYRALDAVDNSRPLYSAFRAELTDIIVGYSALAACIAGYGLVYF